MLDNMQATIKKYNMSESTKSSNGKLLKSPVYNVVEQDEFQDRVKQIFQILDDILGKSFGAYGAPTIISNYPYSHITKDGYTIAKNIVFDHVNGSQADRVIAGLANDICGRLNYAVGDGTTSAVIATNQIYKAAYENNELKQLNPRPKVLMDAFDSVKEEIVEKLKDAATPITEENLVDTIWKIVQVSSNGNDKLTKMITDAYSQIGYPAIRCETSDSAEMKLVITRGYPCKAKIVDDIYINTGNDTAEYKNSDIIIFDHRVMRDTYEKILRPIAALERQMKRHLICLAPSYDEVAIQTIIKRDIVNEFKATMDAALVMLSYPANTAYDRRMISDLAVLVGTELFDRDMEREIIEKLDSSDNHIPIHKLINIMERNIIGIRKITDSMEIVITTDDNLVVSEVSDENNSYVLNMGFVTHASAKRTDSVFQCEYFDASLYNKTLKEAKRDLDEIRKKYEILGTYTQEVYYAQNRYESLKMYTATIYVGGDSALSRDMLKDSVDDAIKAAASAYQFGYVKGCNVTILRIIRDMIDESVMDKNTDPLRKIVLDILYEGYYQVFCRVLSNAFPDDPKKLDAASTEKIINALDGVHLNFNGDLYKFIDDAESIWSIICSSCLSKNKVFDLNTFEFNDDIINSTKTDIEILTATVDLLKLLLAGNQAIIANYNKTYDL